MLTPRQQAIYRPLVERAWQADCQRSGCHPGADGARETWYRRQLVDCLGVYTTKQCNQTTDLDALLGHFAAIAGDDYWVRRASASAERRMLWVIKAQLSGLAAAEGRPADWNYVRAIYAQMNRHHLLPELMSDCPASLLRKVIQAINTHVRRLNHRHKGMSHAA
jgi:hypothetical protein